MKKKKIFFPAIIVSVLAVFLAVIIIVLQVQISELRREYGELNEALEKQ